MRTKNLCILFAVLVLIPNRAFAGRTILYFESECCRPISQGEFAILFCQALKLPEPLQGWTVQGAASALSASGHQPEKGWNLSRSLSEATLANLLQNSKLDRKQFSDPEFRRSAKPVTVAGARNAVPTEDVFTQGEFAILLVRALKIPASADGDPNAAARLLSSQPIPLKPLGDWQVNAPLREKEMLEILSMTPFRASSVDATAEVSALQAYSLLFGGSEIATQGHFGLYVVEALGVPPPSGGWTMQRALDYVDKEFDISGGFGMHRNNPLCPEFFVNSLRQILLKVWQPAQSQGSAIERSSLMGAAPEQLAPFPSLERDGLSLNSSSGFMMAAQQRGGSPGTPPRRNPAWPSVKEVDNYIKELRASGLLPSNQCQPVSAQGFSKSEQGPAAPQGSRQTAPSRTPQQEPPATSSTPIPPLR